MFAGCGEVKLVIWELTNIPFGPKMTMGNFSPCGESHFLAVVLMVAPCSLDLLLSSDLPSPGKLDWQLQSAAPF